MSEKVLKPSLLIPLFFNVLFMVSGICLALYGLSEMLSVAREAIVKAEEEDLNASVDAKITIAMAILDFSIGAYGLVSVILNKRILLIIYAFLLIACIAGNLMFVVAFGVKSSSDLRRYRRLLSKEMVSSFGDHSSLVKKEFTVFIEKYQREMKCCGWTGIKGRNVFLETPWYVQVNKGKNDSHRTLPDSCCLKREEGCSQATNVNAAREKGFVYSSDCLDKTSGEYSFHMWLIIIKVLISTVVQLIALSIAGSVIAKTGNQENES